MLIDEVKQVWAEADCLISQDKIEACIDELAAKITRDYRERTPVLVCVMNGGLTLAQKLSERLAFPHQMDFVHASRYGDETMGKELTWRAAPRADLLASRHVIIIDDIFDVGITLEAIHEAIDALAVASVASAVLVSKTKARTVEYTPRYVAAEIPDRYVFGMGMDYKGYLRHVQGIYAVKGL